MLTVVVFTWGGARPIYGAWHALNMRTMIAKHLTVPHRFVVVTDDERSMRAAGLEAYPIWRTPPFPSRTGLRCCVRLGLFSPLHGGQLGDRIFAIDLDAVIRANIDSIVTSPAPVKFLSFQSREQLQGGMLLVTPGKVTPDPWEAIHHDRTLPDRAFKWVGSDQAVMSELYYPQVKSGEIPHWDESDGVIVNNQIRERDDWRIFFRTGARKCWVKGMTERDEYFAQSGADINWMPKEATDIRNMQLTREKRYCVLPTDLPRRFR